MGTEREANEKTSGDDEDASQPDAASVSTLYLNAGFIILEVTDFNYNI